MNYQVRLKRAHALIQHIADHRHEFVLAITKDVGKPIRESQEEIASAIKEAAYIVNRSSEVLFSREVDRSGTIVNLQRLFPIGNSLVLSPYNFPVELSIWGVLSNFICGNPVFYSPSERTPCCNSLLDRAFTEHLGREAYRGIGHNSFDVYMLVRQFNIKLLWLIGSNKAADQIREALGSTEIKLIMELGGSSPCLVFESAFDKQSPREIANFIVGSRFYNTGQVCSCIKRLYVERQAYDTLIPHLIEAAEALEQAPPEEGRSQLGRLTDHQIAECEQLVGQACMLGAEILTGGNKVNLGTCATYAPTLLSSCNHDMQVLYEEVFLPILPIICFDYYEEAISLANDTRFGLSGFCFTGDAAQAEQLIEDMEVSRLLINCGKEDGIRFPLDGFKQSGNARQQGDANYTELTRLKYIRQARPY